MTKSEEEKDKKMQEALQGIEQQLGSIQAGKIPAQQKSQPKSSKRNKRSRRKKRVFNQNNQEKKMNSNENRPQQKRRPQQGQQPHKQKPHAHKARRPQRPRKGPQKQQGHHKGSGKNKLRIIPLGGLEEVGKNMMLFEYGNDIMIVDMGFQFPTEDMLGIDYVIPDVRYLEKKKRNVRGVVLTHGHLDHIGAIPYVLPKLGFPDVYGMPLTIGFVKKQITEFKQTEQAKLHTFKPEETLKLGCFKVSFFRVNHSIPDAVALVIETPVGRIVHTGDFKFDATPNRDQKPIDLRAIGAIGKKGVLALISDSTNALEPGHTVSEKVVGENLENIIKNTKGRLVVASFSSLIGRLQNIMDAAQKCNRKIFISGRSMITNVKIAQQLGYIQVPKGLIIDIRKMKKYKDSEIIALTTGSQGEDFAALARIATNDHAHVRIRKGDTIVISASPIIGNEAAIIKVINRLAKKGARIITNKQMPIHTSGHAKQDELMEMINLIKPKYLIPEHGDFYMRSTHAQLGVKCGVPKNHIFLIDNGGVIEVDQTRTMTKSKEKVPVGHVMVEGPERSEVGAHVLMDRQLMAENGVLVVTLRMKRQNKQLIGKPRVESRGFVYADSSAQVLNEIVNGTKTAYDSFRKGNPKRFKEEELVRFIQQSLDRMLVRMLDKRPLVLPTILYV